MREAQQTAGIVPVKGFQNHGFGNLFAAFLACLAPVAASCTLNQQRETLPYSDPLIETNRIVEVLDYQGRAEGAELAEWAPLYINGGIAALEKTDEFEPYYVFVAEQTSSNLDTLLQWARNFNVKQDFTQLVFLRAYNRLTANLSVNPDELYGVFFETVMKRIAASRWPQAERYTGTWLLVRRLREDLPGYNEETPAGEPDQSGVFPLNTDESADDIEASQIYLYLILCVIEKTEIENGLRNLMNEMILGKKFPRDQAQAVNAVKSNFFNGF
jgi:hypothetical protein